MSQASEVSGCPKNTERPCQALEDMSQCEGKRNTDIPLIARPPQTVIHLSAPCRPLGSKPKRGVGIRAIQPTVAMVGTLRPCVPLLQPGDHSCYTCHASYPSPTDWPSTRRLILR